MYKSGNHILLNMSEDSLSKLICDIDTNHERFHIHINLQNVEK